MTAEDIQQHINDLELALVDPTISVEFEGRKLALDSADLIIRRIKYFKNKLRALSTGRRNGPRRLTVYTNTKKGL